MADPKGGAVAAVATKAVKATPEGAAASAVAGAKGANAKTAAKTPGAKKPAAKKSGGARLGKIGNHGRKWLLAEFVVCVLLLGLAGMTGKAGKAGSEDDPNLTGSHMAIRGSAIAGVFLVLGLVSAGGKGAEKAAGALGLVITLAYVFESKDAFTTISKWASSQGES